MQTAVSFIIVLGVLIFVHELGHFLLAKWCGIRVERFSLGFPPRMFGKKIGDTDYCVSWIPLGGYVKMAGLVDESMDDNLTGAPWEFQSKPAWQRFLVIFAGPAMNYLLAILIYASLYFVSGIPVATMPIVSEVTAESPAAAAGLQAGDRVYRLNNDRVVGSDELTAKIQANGGVPLTLSILRGSDSLSVVVTPKRDENRGVAVIGILIGQDSRLEKVGPFTALAGGFQRTIYLTTMVGKSLAMIISGAASIKESLAGPIGIAKMVGQVAQTGMQPLLELVAFLSMQLAILNVLPIPVLDGGHIVFIFIESIMRKPVPVKTRMVFQQIGMALLLALMVFIIFNDIRKLL